VGPPAVHKKKKLMRVGFTMINSKKMKYLFYRKQTIILLRGYFYKGQHDRQNVNMTKSVFVVFCKRWVATEECEAVRISSTVQSSAQCARSTGFTLSCSFTRSCPESGFCNSFSALISTV
jgi:hypothetical protein